MALPYRILTFNALSPVGLSRLPQPAFDVGPAVADPDAILLRSHPLSPAEIAPSVLCVARAGAGVNNIPVSWLSERGIPVFNTPGANANAVKELVAAGLLLGARGVIEGLDFVRGLAGETDEAALHARLEQEKRRFRGGELRGKTLGVVGLGAIGARVAEMGLTLGMQVIGHDPALSVEAAWRLPNQVGRVESLAALLARSDFVSLHLPLLDSTRGLIDRTLLRTARHGLRLLNFARPEVVDVPALVEALESGRLARYISDFPVPALLGRGDVLLLPHIGASTTEAEDNCAVMAADQLRDFLLQGNVQHAVNFPAVKLEYTEGYRLTVANRNVPSILGSVLAVLAEERRNVLDMLNKSRGEVAYNLIDLDQPPSEAALARLRALEGVTAVRLLAPPAAH